MKVTLLFLSLLPLPFILLLLLLLIVSPNLPLIWIRFSFWALLGVVCLLVYLSHILWLKPLRVRWKLHRQGINGPRPSFLYGNVPEMQRIQSAINSSSTPDFIAHDYTSTLFPYFELWRKQYGMYVYIYNKKHQHTHTHSCILYMYSLFSSLMITEVY